MNRDIMKSNRGRLIAWAILLLVLLAGVVRFSVAESQSKGMGVQDIRAVEQLGGDRYALVIGINQYADKKIPALASCENDAQSLYQLLTDPHIGGLEPQNTRLLLDAQATTRNIKKELDALRKIPSSSTVFVYFSGHGAKEADEAYWLTQDAELDSLAASAISDSEIRRFLGKIPCERVVVMLDCCYAAATVKSGQRAVTDFTAVLQRFTGKGRAFLMAAGSGEEAIEAKDLKRGVFTHYLVEGLKGLADADGDGVISLTELTGFIDRKVADEARIRGGIQRPVVKMDDVQEPGKFRLTINAERILRNLRETAEVKQRRAARLDKLKQLYLNEKLSLDLYQLGQRLLQATDTDIENMDRQKLAEFINVLEDKLSVEKLQRALDAIETPEQRQQRMEREATERAARQRQMRMDSLLATAKANDSKENGKTALAALDELLRLDGTHREAVLLRTKIAKYYGPNVGDTKILDLPNGVKLELVWIPPGECMMGEDSSAHRVKLTRGFWMGKYEVTQAQYEAVMRKNLSNNKGQNNPVENVNWNDAIAFCEKIGARLPTEAEWEYACRAGTTTKYSSGDTDSDLARVGWYEGNSGKTTHPVGGKEANAWGLHDMHGNVWEWCADWYGDYPSGQQTDPTGPSSGQSRVLRGGSFRDVPGYCRCALRNRFNPVFTLSYNGFRVVLGSPR